MQGVNGVSPSMFIYLFVQLCLYVLCVPINLFYLSVVYYNNQLSRISLIIVTKTSSFVNQIVDSAISV